MTPKEIEKLVVGGHLYDSINTDKSIEIGRANDIEGYSYIVYKAKNPYPPHEDLTIIELNNSSDSITVHIKTHISFKDIEDYIQYFQDNWLPDRNQADDMEFQFRSPDLFKM
jgi:hypothetical protein|tara:strand:- start:543 stop:878 length:336 start_codon:yes stop_codon:yes gene_type:complete